MKQENPMKVTMSAPRLKGWLLLASLLVTISAARPGQAQVIPSVGNIQVCYNCEQDFGFGSLLDGPTFVIHNTSSSSITNGVLKIGPGGGLTDFFNVGTIGTGETASFKAVVPGLSNDGGSGHTFFAFTGHIRDTSDIVPNGNDTQFEFTGRQGSKAVDSGVFTPAATRGDGTNFLNCDHPNCFNQPVANLIIPSTFSVTVTQPLQPGLTNFNWASGTGGPTLTGALDYTNSGTVVSGITVKGTINIITDSGWGNQFDALTLNTPFFGEKCLHQQIAVGGNLFFACLSTLYQCQKKPGGSFTGPNCPVAATGGFIESTLEFENDLSSINMPGLIEGADNAQVCTSRPSCENLTNIFDKIQIIGPVIINGKGGHLSIFVPFSTP
jgi:hypothetical protein